MTSGYILIVAVLVLGGLLATLGDRIGTKVGKARLSLFNLRPRKTATVVTILTGSLISASTLGILFGLSESLRRGTFELDNILRQLRIARGEVDIINQQKNQVEQELTQTRSERTEAEQRLNTIRRSFQQARSQLREISQQAASLRSEIKTLLTERQGLIQQRDQLRAQVRQVNAQIQQLNTQVTQLRAQVEQRDQELAKRDLTIEERNQQLAEQDEAIARFDQTIAERDQVLAERAALLQDLEDQLSQRELQLAERNQQLEESETQLAFLKRELALSEQYYENYQVLRQGNVALLRGQVLASGVVRVVEPSGAKQAVDQLLREANRTAVEITRASTENSGDPLVQILQTQVDQLVSQIKDGQDYVVRILSAGNYVEGEKSIQVFADVALNQVVFAPGEVLATVSSDSSTMTNEQIRQRLDQLLAASQFRARRAGVLGDVQIGDGRITTIIRFIEALNAYSQPVEVRAVAEVETYTAGPLKIQLVATLNGQVVFST